MKKENKKLAQQRKAAEREKKEKRDKVVRLLIYWGPVVLSFVAIVIVVAAIATSGSKNSNSVETDDNSDIEMTVDSEDTEEKLANSEMEIELESEDAQTDEDTEAAVLNTKAGLEAADGDKVNIDFVGKYNGEEFEGGSSNGAGYDIVLGSHTFIDGFEEGIVGHKVGETFDLNLKFPDPYPNNESLAGKDVVFTTTLNGIYK